MRCRHNMIACTTNKLQSHVRTGCAEQPGNVLCHLLETQHLWVAVLFYYGSNPAHTFLQCNFLCKPALNKPQLSAGRTSLGEGNLKQLHYSPYVVCQQLPGCPIAQTATRRGAWSLVAWLVHAAPLQRPVFTIIVAGTKVF
jgi:hypothetical protein